jgi:hypothetical protein
MASDRAWLSALAPLIKPAHILLQDSYEVADRLVRALDAAIQAFLNFGPDDLVQ